jgi:hypothetical protein
MSTVHTDWRSKIFTDLRDKRSRVSGDYIQRNLDRFDTLLPRLRVGREVVMQRRDISDLTQGEWSEASITTFLQHLQRAGVISVTGRGARGLGLTLREDLTESPWKSRRSEESSVSMVEETQDNPLVEDVEFESMPTPVPPSRFEVPEGDDYSTSVDLDLTLAALDAVARDLLGIDLSFAKDFAGRPAAALYGAQEKITQAVRHLEQIRSALGAGDDSDLEGIVDRHAG